VLIASAAAAGIALFNLMIRLRNGVDFAFASIDAMLKKRYDLIPNLVEVCKGHMAHERGVLAEITELRARALHSAGDETLELNGRLSGRLKEALVLAEAYPQLKASESFDYLARSLNEVEGQIAAARRAYNAAVLAYNNACEMIPTNLVAAAMGLRLRRMFEAPEAERAPVKVSAG
jgi:LemA protein